jgi:hypothetical protein
MDQTIQEQLRQAWMDQEAKRNETASTAACEIQRSCRYHIMPFDAIESEDPRRPGVIRSDCRHCGQFLGFRPAN